MSKDSKSQESKVALNESAKTAEFKVFAKSDSPKTVKETIKLVLNLFVNLFG